MGQGDMSIPALLHPAQRKRRYVQRSCRKSRRWMALTAGALIIASFGIMKARLWSQKVKTVDGVRFVHNSKAGIWGKNPRIALELMRTLGEVEAKDQNFAFYLPSDIAVDANGNLYVLDSGNHRIQKFSPDGNYIATFGRQGQGPAEFFFPLSLEIDTKGYLYVSDPNNQRIVVLTPEGKDHKVIKVMDDSVSDIVWLSSGRLAMGGRSWFLRFGDEKEKAETLPRLIKILGLDGEVVRKVGIQHDFKNFLLNRFGNSVQFAVDSKEQVYLAFLFQNRVEKYSPEGRLLWRADRELNYSTEPKYKGEIQRGERSSSVRRPKMNTCSNGIAVDHLGRVWVVTLNRQLKKEEEAGIGITINYSGAERSIGYKVEGEAELRKTNAYKLEVYDPEGVLQGEIPVDCFVDGISIYGNMLFLLDKMRGTKFNEYRIIEK
jgi:sugar lactone lactonase YvrE